MDNILRSKLTWVFGVGFICYYLIRRWAAGGVNRYKPDLTGKCVILTGGNAGIGKEAAKELAKLNANVIVTVRDSIKGEQTVNDIKAYSKNNNVEYMLLDLASLEDIRRFEREFKKKNRKVDILINNAGVLEKECRKTRDGFESHFGVNHLAPFLLTNLFLNDDLVNKGGRIVNVASMGHRHGKINFDDLQTEKPYVAGVAYTQSKLGNVLFTHELAKRLEKDNRNITAVSLHPGLVISDIWRNYLPHYMQFMVTPLLKLFMKTNYEGAQTTLAAALCPKIDSGSYWEECKPIAPHPNGLDDETSSRLWDVSAKLVGLN